MVLMQNILERFFCFKFLFLIKKQYLNKSKLNHFSYICLHFISFIAIDLNKIKLKKFNI